MLKWERQCIHYTVYKSSCVTSLEECQKYGFERIDEKAVQVEACIKQATFPLSTQAALFCSQSMEEAIKAQCDCTVQGLIDQFEKKIVKILLMN